MLELEPEVLRNGKAFHRLVQEAWSGKIEGAQVRAEHNIFLHTDTDHITHQRLGRMDLFIDQIEDFVSIVEIKSTDWDRVAVSNRSKLLGSHRRQVLRYVDAYLEHHHVSVCAGILYPRAPSTVDLQLEVERSLNEHGLQVAWFIERPGTDTSAAS